MTDKDELAALKKKVEELEAKVSPPQSTFVPMSDAEHRDWVHQMRERQANAWMPPSAIREMVAAEPKGFMQGVVADNRNAPTSPTAAIPRSEKPSDDRGVNKSGWLDPTPIGVPGGVRTQELIEQQVNA